VTFFLPCRRIVLYSIDVGCGVGYLEHYLLKRGFRKIEAIDLCEEQIQVAEENEEKLKEYGLQYSGKVKFEVADAFDYLRTAQNYDVIAMIDFLEHFRKEEVIQLLQFSFHALRKGGVPSN